MKRYISLFLVMIILLSAISCTKDPKTSSSELSKDLDSNIAILRNSSKSRAIIELVRDIAVQQYVLARVKTEALTEYDFEKGSIEDLQTLTQEALDAWKLAELLSNRAEELADDYNNFLLSSNRPNIIDKLLGFFDDAVFADKDLKWAEKITKTFDSYPVGRQVKGLAQELGTDAKNAYAQLKLAQDMIAGVSNLNAHVFEGFEKAAKAVSATCKTALWVGSAIAAGPTVPIIKAGGLIISGIDTMVTITETGAHIILGDNDKITLSARDIQDKIAPIAAIGGWASFSSEQTKLALLEAAYSTIDYLGNLSDEAMDEAMDLMKDTLIEGAETVMPPLKGTRLVLEDLDRMIENKKVMVFEVNLDRDGDTEVKISEVPIKDKSSDEVTKELVEKGLPIPQEKEVTTYTELVDKIESNRYYTEEELEDLIDYLREVLYEAFLDENENENEDEDEDDYELNTPIVTGEFPSPEEVTGEYRGISWFVGEEDDIIEDASAIIIFGPDGLLYFDEDEDFEGPINPIVYDQKTGIGKYSYEYKGNRIISELKFVYQGSGIHLSESIKTEYGEIRFEGDK